MRQVIVLGPVPDSAGGIGVLMGHVARQRNEGVDFRFVDSGGTPGKPWRRMLRFFSALRVCGGTVPEGTVFHVNLSSELSTWRKLALTSVLSLRGRPYVLHLHGGRYREFVEGSSRTGVRLIRGMFHRAAGAMVLGDYWRATVVTLFGVDPATITVVPNAVPGPREVPRRDGPPVVLFSGQLSRRKGVHDLVEAWRRLPDEVRTTLVLAGDDPDPEATAALLEGVSDVEVTGWLGPEQLRERLAQASVLVLPSYAENLPMSLLDAMAWGLAPVVTEVGAVGEVVEDGRSAVVVPVEDPAALATALEDLLRDPARIARTGAAARRRWEQGYRIEDYGGRLKEVYDRVASARHGGTAARDRAAAGPRSTEHHRR